MNWIIRLAWIFYGQHLQNRLVRKAKRKGLAVYLRFLQGGRLFLVVVLAAVLLLQTMILAAFGAVVTGFMLWDFDPHTKMQILLGLFSALFVVPLGLLIWGLSARTWYRHSGAAKMMDELGPED